MRCSWIVLIRRCLLLQLCDSTSHVSRFSSICSVAWHAAWRGLRCRPQQAGRLAGPLWSPRLSCCALPPACRVPTSVRPFPAAIPARNTLLFRAHCRPCATCCHRWHRWAACTALASTRPPAAGASPQLQLEVASREACPCCESTRATGLTPLALAICSLATLAAEAARRTRRLESVASTAVRAAAKIGVRGAP